MKALRKRQKGATAVVVAVMLVVLLGFTALAVDIGRLMVSKNELQNAADAAAMAGANTIGRGAGYAFPPTGANLTVVNNAVADSLTAHNITPVTPTVNWWNTLDPSVSKHWAAVQVQLTRTENLFFAPLIGNGSSDVGAKAVAVVGPPARARTLPFAVSYCAVIKGWDATSGQPRTGSNDFAFGDPPTSLKEKGICGGSVVGTVTANDTLKVAASDANVRLLTAGTKLTYTGTGGTGDRFIQSYVGGCNLSVSPPTGTCEYALEPLGSTKKGGSSGPGNANSVTMTLDNGPIGNWTPLEHSALTSTGTDTIRDYIPGQRGTAPPVAIGDEIFVRTGAIATLYDAIAQCSCGTTVYDANTSCSFKPQCLRVTVPVVNGKPCTSAVDYSCPGTSGTDPLDNTPLSPLGATDGTNLPVIGFACIQIRQVVKTGSNLYFAGTLESGCSVAGTPGGGAYYGVSTSPLLGK